MVGGLESLAKCVERPLVVNYVRILIFPTCGSSTGVPTSQLLSPSVRGNDSGTPLLSPTPFSIRSLGGGYGS